MLGPPGWLLEVSTGLLSVVGELCSDFCFPQRLLCRGLGPTFWMARGRTEGDHPRLATADLCCGLRDW